MNKGRLKITCETREAFLPRNHMDTHTNQQTRRYLLASRFAFPYVKDIGQVGADAKPVETELIPLQSSGEDLVFRFDCGAPGELASRARMLTTSPKDAENFHYASAQSALAKLFLFFV